MIKYSHNAVQIPNEVYLVLSAIVKLQQQFFGHWYLARMQQVTQVFGCCA